MNPENVPDMTISQLREMGEDSEYSLSDEEYEEMMEEYQDMWDMTKFMAMAMGVGELFVNDKITFREYIEYVEWIEDEAREKGVSLP